jgi:hypothetical protein
LKTIDGQHNEVSEKLHFESLRGAKRRGNLKNSLKKRLLHFVRNDKSGVFHRSHNEFLTFLNFLVNSRQGDLWPPCTLAFSGGALTPPSTKGMLHPFGNPAIGSPQQAAGYF